jgi:hypothetical protein
MQSKFPRATPEETAEVLSKFRDGMNVDEMLAILPKTGAVWLPYPGKPIVGLEESGLCRALLPSGPMMVGYDDVSLEDVMLEARAAQRSSLPEEGTKPDESLSPEQRARLKGPPESALGVMLNF